ncbi:MAG: CbtA family protein [Alphaproteobacteria bacterium]
MFRSVLITGIVAGICAGLLVSVVQMVKVTPLILAAESYEQLAAAKAAKGGKTISLAKAKNAGAKAQKADEAWQPADGLERQFYSFTANILIGVGFGLLLVAGFVLSRREVDLSKGVMWGLGGFFMFNLAPALGLAPELPGMNAAELGARQMWWLATVLASGGGLGLIVFTRPSWAKALGTAIIIAPHVIGAPHPSHGASLVPAELAAQFVMASLTTSLLFWAVLGASAGYLYRKLG